MITAQIKQIEARIAEIYSLPHDDFIASMYMAEMERLIQKKTELEILLTPSIDRSIHPLHLGNSKPMETFKLDIHFN